PNDLGAGRRIGRNVIGSNGNGQDAEQGEGEPKANQGLVGNHRELPPGWGGIPGGNFKYRHDSGAPFSAIASRFFRQLCASERGTSAMMGSRKKSTGWVLSSISVMTFRGRCDRKLRFFFARPLAASRSHGVSIYIRQFTAMPGRGRNHEKFTNTFAALLVLLSSIPV